MIRLIRNLFNKACHYVFGADRRRSRSERKLSPYSANSRGTIGRPFMSDARDFDAMSVETGSRNANEKPEDSMLIMEVEHSDGSGELRGVGKKDGVIYFSPEKWKYVKALVLRQI